MNKVPTPYLVEPDGTWHKSTPVGDDLMVPPCIQYVNVTTLRGMRQAPPADYGTPCQKCQVVAAPGMHQGGIRHREDRNTRERMWYASLALHEAHARDPHEIHRHMIRQRMTMLGLHYKLNDVASYFLRNETDAMFGFRRMYVAQVIPGQGVVTGDDVYVHTEDQRDPEKFCERTQAFYNDAEWERHKQVCLEHT